MHDGQVEDRLRSALRAEGDALPLTITPDELERRLALRGRERNGRRVSLIAAGVAVIAIGSVLAATGGWFGSASVGGSPEPSTIVEPSIEPTAASTSEPTEAGLPCSTIKPNPADQPPTLVLGATPGDSIRYGGALGAYRIGDRFDGVEGSWTSIDPASLERVPAVPPTERLVALAGFDACVTGLVADAVPIDARDAPALPLADLSIAPTRQIEFDKPPSGEWLVRIHVTFATQGEVPAWSETFFRVDARNPSASLGPVLGNLPVLNTPPGTVFLDEHSAQLQPSDPTGLTEETVVGRVQPRGMYIVSMVCLGSSPMRWSIGHEGQQDALVAGDQTCDGTQSEQAVELGIPADDLDVVLQGDPASAWRIIVATITDTPLFVPPALRMWVASDPDGADAGTQAYGRCVSTAGRSDQCAGEWFVLDGVRSILLSPGGELTFALRDGWSIDQARITAAVTDQARVKLGPTEYSVGFVENGGPEVTIPVELGRGSWIVRVALNATRDGDTFGAYYDLPLFVGE
jgi:hypothetical protein